MTHQSLYTYLDGDRLHEECGIFGIYNHLDASTLTALGLHALQHRGQESAGIVSFDGQHFYSEKRMGLVSDNFTDTTIIDHLKGHVAIGHVRYSTTGETVLRNVQPLFADLASGGFACAHNGNLTNACTLRHQLVHEGSIFQSTSDTEIILQLVARSRCKSIIERVIDALHQIEGAYSFIMLSNKKLIAARDPLGIRPLVLGDLNGSPVIASETCALDIINAQFVREIENGEIVVITQDGIKTIKPFNTQPPRPCLFEYIYFSRPDSILNGQSVYEYRKKFGEELAKENPCHVDMVIPIPDSGVPAALGYATKSKIPFEMGIIRNHYVGRTFIQPTQTIRRLSVKRKHNPNKMQVAGKRVVLIDDSIVRGTTSVKIVEMMREAGAIEVHMRIAAPPIIYPDFYGIDTPDSKHLLAATHNLKEMCDYMKADSLAFLSIDGIYRAMGHPHGRHAESPQYTDHCFTGDYPTSLTDKNNEQHDDQLSLLQE